MLVIASLLATLVGTSASIAVAVTGPSSSACGEALTPEDIATIVGLSDTTTITGATTLDRLENAVSRNQQITEILVRHRDWRGLFAIGLDGVEESAVMPLQRNPAAFDNSEWASSLSLDLLRRFLVAVHAEFTGAPTTPDWAQHFDMTKQCTLSPGLVAMTGYTAHLTVDLSRAVAAVGGRPENSRDYFRIVDAIASNGTLVVDRTKAAYGVDFGPLWRFYFVGEGLDRLAGQGVATGALLRVADAGANTVIFANGLALQNPSLAAVTEIEIDALWRTSDAALAALSQLGGL